MSPPWLSPACPCARLIPVLATSSFQPLIDCWILWLPKIPDVSCKILINLSTFYIPIMRVRLGTGSVRVKYGLSTGSNQNLRRLRFPKTTWNSPSHVGHTRDFLTPVEFCRFWMILVRQVYYTILYNLDMLWTEEAIQSDAKFAQGTCPNCLSWSRRAWSVRLSAAAACGHVCSYHHTQRYTCV